MPLLRAGKQVLVPPAGSQPGITVSHADVTALYHPGLGAQSLPLGRRNAIALTVCLRFSTSRDRNLQFREEQDRCSLRSNKTSENGMPEDKTGECED